MIRAPIAGTRRSASSSSGQALVEAAGDLPHQLDVLALVLPDRHLGGAVGEDVGRLQDGIEKQAAERLSRADAPTCP